MMLRDNAQATVPELMTNPLSSVGKSSKPKVGKTIPGPWKKTRKYFAWIFLLTSIMEFCQPIFFTHLWFNILMKLSKILAYIDFFTGVLIIGTIGEDRKYYFVWFSKYLSIYFQNISNPMLYTKCKKKTHFNIVVNHFVSQ